jgi:hypothetical protein
MKTPLVGASENHLMDLRSERHRLIPRLVLLTGLHVKIFYRLIPSRPFLFTLGFID